MTAMSLRSALILGGLLVVIPAVVFLTHGL
jgi:hypothetical protein